MIYYSFSLHSFARWKRRRKGGKKEGRGKEPNKIRSQFVVGGRGEEKKKKKKGRDSILAKSSGLLPALVLGKREKKTEMRPFREVS